MSTDTTASPTTGAAAPSAGVRTLATRWPLPVTGLVTGIASGLLAMAVAAIGRAADVPVAAPYPGSDGAEAIPYVMFFVSALIWVLLGTGVAALVRRRAERPARTFTWIAAVAALLSLGQPLTADTDTASIVVLVLAHVVVALTAIPVLAGALPRERR